MPKDERKKSRSRSRSRSRSHSRDRHKHHSHKHYHDSKNRSRSREIERDGLKYHNSKDRKDEKNYHKHEHENSKSKEKEIKLSKNNDKKDELNIEKTSTLLNPTTSVNQPAQISEVKSVKNTLDLANLPKNHTRNEENHEEGEIIEENKDEENFEDTKIEENLESLFGIKDFDSTKVFFFDFMVKNKEKSHKDTNVEGVLKTLKMKRRYRQFMNNRRGAQRNPNNLI